VAVAKGDRILWEEGFGLADRERQIAATPRTIYSLASISKPFTATALMTLVEAGALDLDQPANRYLGEARLRAFEGEVGGATLRRLLTHTAGLPLHYQFFYDGQKRVHSDDEAIRRYGILVYPPGETYFYSNLGYGILGHIISRVSGKAYADFMQEVVFEPLDLANTTVSSGRGLKGAAVRYDNELKPLPPYTFDHVAASGVWSSARDLVRFGMFHLRQHLPDQQPILQAGTIEQMQRSDAPADGPGQARGLGWAIAEMDNGYRRVSHTGSMPGVTTILNLYPSEEVVVVVLQNRNNGGAAVRVANAIAGIVLPQYLANRDTRQERGNVATSGEAGSLPSSLGGSWQGRIIAPDDSLALRVEVRADGDVHVQLGAQLATLLTGARLNDGWLTGRFGGRLRPPDATPATAQYHVAVALNLKRRGDRLTGWASSITTTPLAYGAVSYRAELERAGVGQGGNANSESRSPETRSRIDSVFAEYSRAGSPGCAVSAVHNNALVMARGYGLASVEHALPITPNTAFYAASVSKQFTAYAVALLAEQGKISLDDDIRKWIPEVPEFGSRITIRHLIHHTSGLRDYFGLLGLTGWPMDGPLTESEFLDLVSRQRALNFKPGERHLYSNTGYVLLAILVERVSGKSLREFADEQMFQPLGMENSAFRDDHARLIDHRALAYAPMQNGGYRVSVPGFDVIGDGGLYTTVEDLARWNLHFLQSSRDAKGITALTLTRGTLLDGQTIPYAFGLSHGEYRGAATIAHGGSYGGYRTYVLRFPEQDFAVATLCNIATANPAILSQRVADILIGDALEERPEPRPAPRPAAEDAGISTARAAQLSGVYWAEESQQFRRIALRDGRLSMSFGGPWIPLLALSADSFLPAAGGAASSFRTDPIGAIWLEQPDGSGETIRYRKMPAPEVSARTLTTYSGTFYSEELDTTWRVEQQDGALVIRRRGAGAQPLEPLFTDAFMLRATQLSVLRFTRDAGRRVSGFTLSAGRVTGLSFRRLAR
jgi:CubicO group peptidase (beta-lactamase class C family)